MARNMPGTTDFDVRPDDAVWLIINGIDNRVDDVLGARPGRAIGRLLTAVAPANLICTVTSLEKPSKLVEEKMDGLERDLASKRIGRPF